ncbi:MAG: RNA polymerase-associated protein RapA [Gammaproteobacteria bacterium]|nr:RNA polymerase-associated protein RapA [Gammaproteobacteria bacterium]
MTIFTPGQRWISSTELELGLGTVQSVDHRSVSITFPAIEETRTYAIDSAPLSRVRFAEGEEIRSEADWLLTIEKVQERDGLITYEGTGEDGVAATLKEQQLHSQIQLNRPVERLFNGQLDSSRWFELRYQTQQHRNRILHSDVYGLCGARTSLIPHQLYIAHEVGRRYAPRVLLADEVGLGKTIEAGMILHQQLLTERAQRVLIVVPESLMHQWLVEMLRRFNLHFRIFDEDRCQAAEESTGQGNPFDTEQLVLCNLEFLLAHPQRFEQARAADWDLLVVDEAHHLQWSPTGSSPEYRLIEQLAAITRGVLLLTATPEQLGKASHFARLRLLDANRFPDFDTFVEEETSYQPIARAIETLLEKQALDEHTLHSLHGMLEEQDNRALLDALHDPATDETEKQALREALIEHLLDRHGTGRVLLRNTRAAVKGFPERRLIPAPLPMPDEYRHTLRGDNPRNDVSTWLRPERAYEQARTEQQPLWCEFDPRVNWLLEQLQALRPEKLLVIVANAQSAIELAVTLKHLTGKHAPVFHEHLSIVERDRAAAHFADPEQGGQVLICSEIGSEGRNFQFTHHLVMFDLPFNPDLLEQRIGRLDRIGQTRTVNIHVPYFEGTPQQSLFNWYHLGLSAFTDTCPAGAIVFAEQRAELEQRMMDGSTALDENHAHIKATRQRHMQLNEQLQKGRDRLLEYNSCRPQQAEAIRQRIMEAESPMTAQRYLEAVFDCFGVDTEIHSQDSSIIRPGNHMHSPFPGLSDDGMTVTYSRATALANEDLQFMSWEHPLMTGAMDMIAHNEMGNTAFNAIHTPMLVPGSLLLECVFVLGAASRTALQASRYLPPTTLRLLVDLKGKDYARVLDLKTLRECAVSVDDEIILQVIQSQTTELKTLIGLCEDAATRRVPEFVERAQRDARHTLFDEIDRLVALQKINPNVREEEIEFYREQWQEVEQLLEQVTPRLDALRVIVAT